MTSVARLTLSIVINTKGIKTSFVRLFLVKVLVSWVVWNPVQLVLPPSGLAVGVWIFPLLDKCSLQIAAVPTVFQAVAGAPQTAAQAEAAPASILYHSPALQRAHCPVPGQPTLQCRLQNWDKKAGAAGGRTLAEKFSLSSASSSQVTADTTNVLQCATR